METFLDWPWQKRLAYMASELLENTNPVRIETLYLKAKSK
jgi:hypothetical protein